MTSWERPLLRDELELIYEPELEGVKLLLVVDLRTVISLNF